MKNFLKWCIWVIPAFIPTYFYRLEIFGLPTNFLEILVGLVFVFWLVNAFIDWLMSKKKFGWLRVSWNKLFVDVLRSKVFWLSVAGIIVVVMSVMIVPPQTIFFEGTKIHEGTKVALGIVKGWIMLPIVYFFMLAQMVRRKEDLQKVLGAYLLSTVPLVLWGFYQLFTGNFITPDARVSGPFVNANYLALYLEPAAAAFSFSFFQRFIGGNLKSGTWILAIGALGTFIILVFTHSYAALFAMFLALAIGMFLQFRNFKIFAKKEEEKRLGKLIKFFALCSFIAFVVLTIGFANTEKGRKFFAVQDRSSTSVRMEIYTVALRLIQQHPFLGIGLGQFEPQYALQAPEILGKAPYEWVTIHPHNLFLAAWLNLGIGGFLLLLIIISQAVVQYFRTPNYATRQLCLVGLVMLLTILIHGLLDTHLFKNDLAMVFAVTLAVCILPRKMLVLGEVIHGIKKGRDLGFPTLNLELKYLNFPQKDLDFGIYSCKVLVKEKWYKGALHYGPRPAIQVQEPSFEIHVLDFNQNIYGQRVEVEILDFVRGVMNFSSLQGLKEQIAQDILVVRHSTL